MKLIAIKTEDSGLKGKLSFYCRMLKVSRQGFYKYPANKDRPWKYQNLAEAMREILSEDECNDMYGPIRAYQALRLKQPEGVDIPGKRTIYRVMKEIGISHRPRHRPNGITKADCEARESDDLLKRDFKSDEPLKSASQILRKSKQKMENFMSLQSLTALIPGFSVWQWIPT